MDTTELEGNRNVEKGKLKHKFALLIDDYQLLDESMNEEIIGRQQVHLSQTEDELAKLLTNL